MDLPLLPSSLFNRMISRPRPVWVTLAVCALLFGLPWLAAFLDGQLSQVLQSGTWRPLLLPAAVIAYILVVAPYVEQSSLDVIRSFRPLVQLEDGQFEQLVWGASRTSPAGEALAFTAGALVGWWMSQSWDIPPGSLWVRLYLSISLALMFGLLAWAIYGSLVATRFTGVLLRQPLDFDLFDIRPFEPIGRESLILGLVFVGGMTLSMVFGLDIGNLYAWETWIVYLPLAVLPVIIFFLNMRDAHRLLAGEKTRQLDLVLDRLARESRLIRQHLTDQQDIHPDMAEFTALSAYEERLRGAPTWPYNIAMLRTLIVTILIPLIWKFLSTLMFDQ